MSAERWVTLAGSIGAQAPALFVLALGALLLLAWGAWAVHGRVQRRVRAGGSGTLALIVTLGAGFGIVAAGAAGFAEIAERLAPGGTLARTDEALTGAIGTHVGTATLQAFAWITRLGDAQVLALLGAAVALALLWRRERTLALAWMLALGGNALLNPTLKRIFERVRPVHEHGFVSETGWSFPSGHTSGATVAYGMLAVLALRLLPPAWHLPAVLAAVAVAFTVGCSRVFLQVHFASDVAAGFASGGAWLAVCAVSLALAERWRPERAN